MAFYLELHSPFGLKFVQHKRFAVWSTHDSTSTDMSLQFHQKTTELQKFAKHASGVNGLLKNNPQTLRWMLCFYHMHIFVNKKVCEIVHNLLYTIFQRPNVYQQLTMKGLYNWQPDLPCEEALSNTKNKTLHYFTNPCPTLQ